MAQHIESQQALSNSSGTTLYGIGLARALYGSPVLLVLDEPNSNLDASGEEALNKAILAAKEIGTTVVLVAHRSSMMTHVDKVAVLRDGQLEMFGTRDTVFSEMRQRQVRSGKPPVRVVGKQTG